jgi:hypothetical protein
MLGLIEGSSKFYPVLFDEAGTLRFCYSVGTSDTAR